MEIEHLEAKAFSLAQAIAKAEGFGVPGALPTRINNPGDMELGDRGWGTEAAKTVYPKADWNADLNDREDGCSALRRECLAILSGASHTFDPRWTFLHLAQEWTGGDKPTDWAGIVVGELGANIGWTLEGYVEAA